jgi:glyoxylate utilization-related uncharacterized protein
VKATDIRDLVRFSEEEPRRTTLHESERVWSEVVCLQGSQRLGPIADEGSDAICTVLAGEIAVQIGKGRERLSQWHSALVPAGQALTFANASEEPSVVLIVAAPPPAPRS